MKRCLFVDDSAVIRKVAKRILSSPDLQILEAASGSDAVAICAVDMPDIIVIDGVLPDMTPVELIRRVRDLGVAAGPQIALCLTEVDVPAIMRAKRAGAHGFLLKPFNRPQLLDRFRAFEEAA